MNKYSTVTVLGFVAYLAILLIGVLAMHKDHHNVQLVAMGAMGSALTILCVMQLYDGHYKHCDPPADCTADIESKDNDHEAAAGAKCHEGPDGCCVSCGVEMSTCPACGGVGYHRVGCRADASTLTETQ